MQEPTIKLSPAVAPKAETEWIDISVTIHDSMTVWPGQPHVNVSKFQDLHKGDDTNITVFSMPVHAGTHVDAPRHIFTNGNDITTAPLNILNGKVRVIEISDKKEITLEELVMHDISENERILFKTKNSQQDWTARNFKRDFVHLSVRAAQYLAQQKVSCVGIDYISMSTRGISKLVHSILFEAGIWVIEGLNLNGASGGCYDMMCLPLKILGSDAAPARVVLKRND